MTRPPRQKLTRYALIALTLLVFSAAPLAGQNREWLPTRGTRAWARFGPRSWKEVRIRTTAFDSNEKVVRSSTTIARSRVNRVGRFSITLCVNTAVEVAGQQFSSEPQEITRDLAPQVVSSKVVGSETVTIGDRKYPTAVIELITKSRTTRDSSTLYHSKDTTPQTLKRITKSVDAQTSNATSTTTVNVTALGKLKDILGETKRTWSVTTVIERHDRTVTIREVHCQDVPGELVSQVTEERDEDGKLLSRKELELVGYGQGRIRRLFRR